MLTLSNSKAERPRNVTADRFLRIGREFFWVAVGQVALVLGAIIGVKILTTLLIPEIYGQLALGMTVATLVSLVVMGPLSNGATRFYASAQEANGLYGYLNAMRWLVLRATGGIIIATVFLCVALALAGQLKWIGLGVASICYSLFSGYDGVLNGIQTAARQRHVVALHQGVASWGRYLTAAAMVLWLGVSSTNAMMGYCLAALLVLISQGWFFRRKILKHGYEISDEVKSSDDHWKKEIFVYTWPFAAWGVLGWGRIVSDRWALQLFSSTHEVGLYTVLFQLGYYPVSILTSMVSTLVAPFYFQRAGDASDATRVRQVYIISWRLTMAALLATFIAAFCAAFIHKPLFAILVSSEYRSVSSFLPVMILASGLFTCSHLCSMGLYSHLETKKLIVPTNITAAGGIFLNLLGAYWFGIIGVLGANIVFSIIHLMLIVFLSLSCFRKINRNNMFK